MNKMNFDFVGKRKIFFIISAVLMAVSIIASFFCLKIAIEFKGGTIITYSYIGEVDTNEISKSIEEIVGSSVNVQQGELFNSDKLSLTVSFSSTDGITSSIQEEITDSVQALYPDGEVEILDSSDVSPSSGRDFLIKCIVAVLFSAIILVIYIALRFKKISGWSAGVCAVCGLLHDVIITYGAFILCGFEINSNFMAVVLTILGYSINDTLVIYDRIRENKKAYPNMTLKELVNKSLNQSFTRSMRTSITTVSTMIIVSIVAVIYGVSSILSFSVPLAIGMTVGTYSSLCLAAPLWVWWQERKPNNKKKSAKKA